jgi:hypothetical protein
LLLPQVQRQQVTQLSQQELRSLLWWLVALLLRLRLRLRPAAAPCGGCVRCLEAHRSLRALCRWLP